MKARAAALGHADTPRRRASSAGLARTTTRGPGGADRAPRVHSSLARRDAAPLHAGGHVPDRTPGPPPAPATAPAEPGRPKECGPRTARARGPALRLAALTLPRRPAPGARPPASAAAAGPATGAGRHSLAPPPPPPAGRGSWTTLGPGPGSHRVWTGASAG